MTRSSSDLHASRVEAVEQPVAVVVVVAVVVAVVVVVALQPTRRGVGVGAGPKRRRVPMTLSLSRICSRCTTSSSVWSMQSSAAMHCSKRH